MKSFHGLQDRTDHCKSWMAASSFPSSSTMARTLVYRPKDLSRQSLIFDPATGLEVQRHADLWFPDGSVVCRAENVLFRVHMSQLARHSVCFRDMFALASSSHTVTGLQVPTECDVDSVDQDILDNCPVIFLQDKAEDLANLFTALYDGPCFGNNNQDDFRVVSGVLRLATKYIIDSLRDKAIAHLSIAWPSTLKGWEAREDIGRTYEMTTETSSGHFYPSPIEVITLAQEVDVPILLPAAFYDLSRYSFSQIFEATVDEPLHGNSGPLSVFDMQRLCIGKEYAQHTITSLIQAMGSSQYVRNAQSHGSHMTHIRRASSGGMCVSAAACRKDFSELVDLATQHYLFDRERGFCDPLYVAEELGQLKSTDLSECKACAKSLELWAGREREKIWKMIPVWFRLESPSRAGSPRSDV
ncbi:hypothetical protein C8J56DRAFT_1164754 [Mycena floridula]|nr:hypothetical protein C8J56DRAFT_1164754 [Mycena floridula]